MILASRATTVERALYASPSETAWLPVIHSVAADRGCAEEPLEQGRIGAREHEQQALRLGLFRGLDMDIVEPDGSSTPGAATATTTE